MRKMITTIIMTGIMACGAFANDFANDFSNMQLFNVPEMKTAEEVQLEGFNYMKRMHGYKSINFISKSENFELYKVVDWNNNVSFIMVPVNE